MKHAICPACGSICSKYGKTTSGSQRWICKNCSITFTQKIDNSSKQLQIFLNWLFSKETQKEMIGQGRSFRRKTSKFWDIWHHRGMSVERRIKAVYWWCYMHSPDPLSASEILKIMPTDKSISDIYKRMSPRDKLEESIPQWGDAIVWNELHRSADYPVYWD